MRPTAATSPSTTPAINAPDTGSRGRVGGMSRQLAVGGLAMLLILGGIGLDRTGVLPGSTASNPADASPQFQLIRDAWDLLHQDYVGRASLNDTALAYAADSALADAVDDPGHTRFETPTEVAQEQAALNGHYVGIGVILSSDSAAGAVVASVLPNSPAARRGIAAGDVITAVAGKSTAHLSLSAISALVLGPSGTQVAITIQPPDHATARQIVLTRQEISLPSVEWAQIPGSKLALVRIDQFSAGATATLVKALSAAHAAGLSGIVLDLRDNPGGLADEAVGVASQFLASGPVYQQRDASGKVSLINVRPGGVATTTPLVVLVNAGTASAAEIVAGALQDAGRAKVVGETTFGTGTVLSQFTLPDGSALLIGTIEWLTRNGHQIWHHGITPNVRVALAAGVEPLLPSNLRTMSANQLMQTSDRQLLDAMRLLDPAR
jgi:carboxyl-terminal processing protease